VFIRILTSVLILLIIFLQYTLWFGKSNLTDLSKNKEALEELISTNQELVDRNNILHLEVSELKNRIEAIEARARQHLGLIAPGETYFHLVKPDNKE
tara:strand:- start:553 stop:843 length:291 start_codon:yes stop_codon:yes gene_type:complete